MYVSGGGLFGYNDQRPATSLAGFFFLFSFTSPSLLAVPSLSISFAFAAGTRNGERRWQRGGWRVEPGRDLGARYPPTEGTLSSHTVVCGAKKESNFAN